MLKLSIRTIPSAAAMTAALMFGAQAQAQTTTPPNTGTGGSANMPAAPNSTPKTMEQRDTAKPMATQGMSGSSATGANADMPAGPNAKPKGAQPRDASKPMAKSGAMAGSSATGDSANMTGEPVRQGDKVAKSKGERMDKSGQPKAKTGKSGEPVREAEVGK